MANARPRAAPVGVEATCRSSRDGMALTIAPVREMMVWRCVMQVQSDHNAATGHAPRDGAFRRFRERIADSLSPTLACTACGSASKQRNCDRTGVVRPVDDDRTWARSAAYEIEHVCPACGESIWVLQATTYLYPAG